MKQPHDLELDQIERILELEAVLSSVPVGVAIAETHEKIVWTNAEWLRILGTTELGDGLTDDGRARLREHLGVALYHGTWLELPYVKKNGCTAITRWRGTRLNNGRFTYFVQDITETRQRDCLLAEQRQRMVQMERLAELGEMAARIAHEINNPLTIISALAQSFSIPGGTAPVCTDQIRRAACKIQNVSGRISRIIKGLRTFARPGASDPFRVHRLDEIVHDAAELCSLRGKRFNIDFQIEIPESVEVCCREVQIGQALINLFNNAIDAVAEQKGSRWIRCSVEDDGCDVIIRVTDSGPGIPEKLRARLTEPFFTTKPPEQGTGLGLTLVRSIMEAHSGSLSLNETSPNTQFVLRLPKIRPRGTGG